MGAGLDAALSRLEEIDPERPAVDLPAAEAAFRDHLDRARLQVPFVWLERGFFAELQFRPDQHPIANPSGFPWGEKRTPGPGPESSFRKWTAAKAYRAMLLDGGAVLATYVLPLRHRCGRADRVLYEQLRLDGIFTTGRIVFSTAPSTTMPSTAMPSTAMPSTAMNNTGPICFSVLRLAMAGVDGIHDGAWEPLLDACLAGLWTIVVDDDQVLLIPRPAIRLDNRDRLHHDTQAAVDWGTERAYYVHGIAVPAKVFEHPESLTAKEIAQATNIEVRRVMLDRFGLDRFMRESGAKRLHADDRGELYEYQFPQLNRWQQEEPLRMVKVINSTPETDGTTKSYWLRVPPDVQTAREAVAWTFGRNGAEYAPAVET